MRAGQPRWVPVVFVAAALGVAGLAAAGPGFVGHEVPPPEAPETETVNPSASATASDMPGMPTDAAPPPRNPALVGLFDALFTAFAAVLTAAVLALLGYLAFRWLRTLLTERVMRQGIDRHGASQPGDGDREAEQVRGAVRAGLADLDAGGDPRQVVIACWLRLERVAAAAGTARMAADTPADLVARLLARHRVDRRTLERFADAYRLARYAPVEVTKGLAEVARDALRDLDAQLRIPAGTEGVAR